MGNDDMPGRGSPSAWPDILLALGIVLASIVMTTLTYGTGLLDGRVATALFDARRIEEVGRALLSGQAPPEDLLSLRAYLYPALGVALLDLHPLALYAVQLGACAIGVFLLARVERTLTGRVIATPVAFLSVSLLLAPAHLMTESLSFCLAAMAMWAALAPARRPWIVPLLAAATIVRSAYLPALLLCLPFALGWSRRSLLACLAAIALLTPQAALNARFDDVAWPSAGSSNFSKRFYPAVLGMVEAGAPYPFDGAEAAAALEARPDLSDQLRYVMGHPLATTRTWTEIFVNNHLISHSGYTRTIPHLAHLSKAISAVFAVCLVLAVLGLLTDREGGIRRTVLLALPAAGLLAPAPLVYWQGDRIIFSALILLLPFTALGLGWLRARFGKVPNASP